LVLIGSLPSVVAATPAVSGLPPPEALPTAAPKWRLFFKVLPLTALFALAKLGVHTLGFEPWEVESLTGSLFGASTFVLAFVLSGTLAAYSASEDMVVQFINAIESIEDVNIYMARLQPGLETAQLTSCLAELLGQLAQWLANQVGFEVIEARLAHLNLILADLRLNSGDSVVDRGLPELARMRILVNRMASNRDSDFLGPAYAMLEIFLVGAVVALLLIGAERFSENMVVSCFLFTSFTYLLLLIRDLDNPFQYDGSSCVDVDLSVLNSCRQRLLARGVPRLIVPD
jgi:hypothetical protein